MFKKYFYYQKNFAGGWTPRTQFVRPSPKGAEGVQKPPIKQVVELPKEHHQCSLTKLKALYPLKEET